MSTWVIDFLYGLTAVNSVVAILLFALPVNRRRKR